MDDQSRPDPDLRHRILAAAAGLIAAGGAQAATTRAVAQAAKVQPPAIYRLFGDKEALLAAVADHVMALYSADKGAQVPNPDPVQDLAEGWDRHVDFGLANPGLFAIMSSGGKTAAVLAGMAVLQARVHALAKAGLLHVSEARAVDLLHAVGTGTVMALLAQPPGVRDLRLSRDAFAAVLAAITGQAANAPKGPVAAAVTLRAGLAALPLTAGERLVLAEWLDRVVAS